MPAKCSIEGELISSMSGTFASKLRVIEFRSSTATSESSHTTTALLGWLFYHLARCPRVFDKLRASVLAELTSTWHAWALQSCAAAGTCIPASTKPSGLDPRNPRPPGRRSRIPSYRPAGARMPSPPFSCPKAPRLSSISLLYIIVPTFGAKMPKSSGRSAGTRSRLTGDSAPSVVCRGSALAVSRHICIEVFFKMASSDYSHVLLQNN